MNPTLLVLCKKEAGIWVAIAIPEWIAAQAPKGGTWQDAVNELGWMFDARDQIIKSLKVNPLPLTPKEYSNQFWFRARSVGRMPLGKRRRAKVRIIDE